MKNTYIVVLGLVLIALGAWYLTQNAPSNGPLTATTTAPAATSSQSGTAAKKPAAKSATSWTIQGVNSLNVLLTQKLTAKCSVTADGRAATLSISGTKARLNFSNASMIDDGTYLYVWSGTSGVRVSATVSAAGSIMASHGGVDPATPFRYGCNTATVDPSSFTPPTGVTFVDGAGNPI